MQDRFGLVPPEIRARYERAEWVDHATTAGRALEQELKSVFGPEMEVVFVKARANPRTLPESCVPGRWHVRRNNPPPAVPTYIPILGPEGSYRDPDMRVVAELAERDLRREGNLQRMLDRGRVDAPHRQRERDLRTEQRRDELAVNYRAARRVRGEGGLKKSFAGKRRAPVKEASWPEGKAP